MSLMSNHVDLEDLDYVLPPDQKGVWITVNNISVLVQRCDEGVSVTLYPLNCEMEDSLSKTWATFSDAAEVIDEQEAVGDTVDFVRDGAPAD